MPMVLGHEAAGEVVEVGPDVGELAPGDHVVLSFVPACTACPQCLAGKGWLCEPGAAANVAGTLLSGERRLHDAGGRRSTTTSACRPSATTSSCPRGRR